MKIRCCCGVYHAAKILLSDIAGSKRTRMQQDMQVEHKATSAVRAANRRAEGQLLQARQVIFLIMLQQRKESLDAGTHP